jgi:hypothetical protein
MGNVDEVGILWYYIIMPVVLALIEARIPHEGRG